MLHDDKGGSAATTRGGGDDSETEHLDGGRKERVVVPVACFNDLVRQCDVQGMWYGEQVVPEDIFG